MLCAVSKKLHSNPTLRDIEIISKKRTFVRISTAHAKSRDKDRFKMDAPMVIRGEKLSKNNQK